MENIKCGLLVALILYFVTLSDGLPGIVKIGKVKNYYLKLQFNGSKLDFYDLVEFQLLQFFLRRWLVR